MASSTHRSVLTLGSTNRLSASAPLRQHMPMLSDLPPPYHEAHLRNDRHSPPRGHLPVCFPSRRGSYRLSPRLPYRRLPLVHSESPLEAGSFLADVKRGVFRSPEAASRLHQPTLTSDLSVCSASNRESLSSNALLRCSLLCPNSSELLPKSPLSLSSLPFSTRAAP